MLLRRFYDARLAQASYMLGCQRSGEAIVVDPGRRSETYLIAAREEGLGIVGVTETHIHADFLSGARELAELAGAELFLSGHGGKDWGYRYHGSAGGRRLMDGDELAVGSVGLRVMHTPGHTPEHICFVVTDGATARAGAEPGGPNPGAAEAVRGGGASPASVPIALLSGDFVFVGDVGRPDLLERAAGEAGTMEEGARRLYSSLQLFRQLPAHLQVLPGHGAGSACGKALGAVPSTTVGYELLVNWAFGCEDEEEFVAGVLADQPEPPTYFARMKRLNRDGPPPRPRSAPSRVSAAEAASMRDEGSLLLDVRARERFAGRHILGSVNVPLTRSLATWCGWVVPGDQAVCLVADSIGRVEPTIDALQAIGIDDVRAFCLLGEESAAASEIGRIAVIDWEQAERARAEEDAVLVDVRGLAEWREGRVPGARRIHLGELEARAGELPADRPVLLHCRTGHRSAIGASILAAAGHGDVRNVDGGWVDRVARGLPAEC